MAAGPTLPLIKINFLPWFSLRSLSTSSIMNLTPVSDGSKLNSASGSFLRSRDSPALDNSLALRELFPGPDPMTFQDIGSALSNRLGRQFDGQLLTEIFTIAGKSPQEPITTDAFIEAYLTIERKLWMEIQRLEGEMQQTEGRIGETKKSMERNNESEETTGSSVLMVTVVEAQNLAPTDSDGSADPYALLQCSGQRIETRYHLNTLNPLWQESFTFKILTSTDILKVLVLDHDDLGSDNFIGQTSVELEGLRDQKEYEEWYDLQDKDGAKSQGRIRLKSQWIWSKAKYLQDVLTEWETIYADDFKAVESLNSALETLKSPFRTSTDTILPQLFGKTSGPLKTPLTWSSLLTIFTLLWLVTVMISVQFRTDFGNLTLGMGSVYVMLTRPQDGRVYKSLSGWLCLAQLYDITWYLTYSMNNNVAVFVTMLGDVLKLALAGMYWKQGRSGNVCNN